MGVANDAMRCLTANDDDEESSDRDDDGDINDYNHNDHCDDCKDLNVMQCKGRDNGGVKDNGTTTTTMQRSETNIKIKKCFREAVPPCQPSVCASRRPGGIGGLRRQRL